MIGCVLIEEVVVVINLGMKEASEEETGFEAAVVVADTLYMLLLPTQRY